MARVRPFLPKTVTWPASPRMCRFRGRRVRPAVEAEPSAAGAALCLLLAHAHAALAQAPVVLSASINRSAGAITITGQNFEPAGVTDLPLAAKDRCRPAMRSTCPGSASSVCGSYRRRHLAVKRLFLISI